MIDSSIKASDRIIDYVLDIADATRGNEMLSCGVSTRGAMVLLRCAKCAAWMSGRDYVTPEDVKAFAPDVLTHRLQPLRGEDASGIVAAVLEDTPAP
jgi:MoxR-like ATPase